MKFPASQLKLFAAALYTLSHHSYSLRVLGESTQNIVAKCTEYESALSSDPAFVLPSLKTRADLASLRGSFFTC